MGAPLPNKPLPNKPLPIKLGIDDDTVFTVVDPPADFAVTLGDTGDAVWQRSLLAPLDVVIVFATARARLLAAWPKLAAAAEPDGAVWVAWPKPGSDVAGDLTEGVLRAGLLPMGWVDNKACAIDETWSALRFVLRKQHRHTRRR